MALKVVAEFSDRFREITEGESYRKIAEKIDLSCPAVSAYMNNQRSPKIPTVKHIANVYGVDFLWLAGYDVPKHEARTPEDADSTAKYIYDNVRAMTPEQQQAVRLIVDQVLALRGDK